MKKWKQPLSIFLVLCMILPLLPKTSWAASTNTASEPTLKTLYALTTTGEMVSMLNNSEINNISLERPYKFVATYSNVDQVEAVYITGMDGDVKKSMKANYDQQSGTFISYGFFDEDENFEPTSIQVEYIPKRPEVYVTETVDWDAIAFEGISAERLTVKEQSDTSIDAVIDISELFDSGSPLQKVLVDTSIEIFDESTGSNISDFLGAYKDLDNLLSYVIEGKKQEKYVVYLDVKPENYFMVVKDVTGNKYFKMILDSNEEFSKLSSTLSTTNQISGALYNYFKIQSDMDELRKNISLSNLDPTQRAYANKKVDELEQDKITFTIMTTVLPLVMSVFAVPAAPAILFSALLNVITFSSDYFWDNRLSAIKSELVYVNIGNLVDTGECGADGDNLIWTLDRYGTLRISGTGEMRNYYGQMMHPSWIKYAEQIRTVVFEPGITSIGDCAFAPALAGSGVPEDRYYSSLTGSLFIPDSVVRIGDLAFSGCSGFNGNLTLPTNLKIIGVAAFRGCSGLTGALTIPNSVTEIGELAFLGCSGFNGRLTISNSVEIINIGTFEECKNLQGTLVIPNSVKEIGTRAFYCFRGSNFSGLTLGNNVETIGDHAFLGMNINSPLYIPASVKTMGNQLFSGYNPADSKTEIFFKGDAPDIFGIIATGTARPAPSFPSPHYTHDIVFRYISGTSGWTESEFYNSAKGTWNGYTLLPWSDNTCEHEYSSVVTEPTCIKQGYTTYTCSLCNESYVDNYTPALGHSYGEWIVTVPATTSANGQRERICSRCGNIETSIILATGSNNSSSTGSSNSSSSGSGSSGTYTIAAPAQATGGSVSIRPGSADAGRTVTITAKPNANYALDTLTVTDRKGSVLDLTDIGGNQFTFVMPASQVTIDASFKSTIVPTTPSVPAPSSGFADVPSDAYYAAPVAWAVAQGITSGTSADTFSPDSPCTRGQIMTFLWRAAGSPAAGGENPFTDVSAGSYYAQAVQWAVSQGITSGTSADTFSPDAACTRAQAMAFLYKAQGAPAVSGAARFNDVDSGAYYADAVQWAVANGVTSGTSASTFGPDSACTRAQIVTFLYNAHKS